MKKAILVILSALLCLTAAACQNTVPPEEPLSSDSTVTTISTPASSDTTSAPAVSSKPDSTVSDTKESSSAPAASSDTSESIASSEPAEPAEPAESSEPPEETSESASVSAESTPTASEEETSEPEVPVSEPEEPVSSAEPETPSEPSEESFADISEMPEQPESSLNNFLSIHTTISSVSLWWSPQDGADGYLIQCSDVIGFLPERTVTQQTDNCFMTFDNLTQNTDYYVRTCTYHLVNGEKVFSDWYSTKKAPLKTIEVIDGVTYIDGTLIANKTYALPSYYGYGLTDETYQAANEMINAAAYDGIYLWIESGFRSYETQSYTYQSFVWDRGTELADLCSARPGHSEHQTGMAIDFNTTSDAFAYTPEAAWIAAHCAEYGFIIRYPQGKEDITGYKYEPWHVRYVGPEKAAAITASGLTLEEYYGITSYYH